MRLRGTQARASETGSPLASRRASQHGLLRTSSWLQSRRSSDVVVVVPSVENPASLKNEKNGPHRHEVTETPIQAQRRFSPPLSSRTAVGGRFCGWPCTREDQELPPPPPPAPSLDSSESWARGSPPARPLAGIPQTHSATRSGRPPGAVGRRLNRGGHGFWKDAPGPGPLPLASHYGATPAGFGGENARSPRRGEPRSCARTPPARSSVLPASKSVTCLCFQMQPFDLLGITIKSLAEIEKEVSGPPGERGRGRASLTHPAAPQQPR